MPRNSHHFLRSTILLLVLLNAGFAAAQSYLYTEDFTSTQFYDSTNSTGIWDTAAGQIGLGILPEYLDKVVPDPTGDCDILAVAGDILYVSMGWYLYVYDISDPENPISLGYCDTNDATILWMVVEGDHLFAAGGDGFSVFDISDPANVTRLTTLDLPSYSKCITIDGDFAFVPTVGAGLNVIDISDPTSPILAGTFTGVTNPACIAIAGNRAYLGTDGLALHVLDIADPTSPTSLGSIILNMSAQFMSVEGDLLYMGGSNGLVIADVSATLPVVIGEYGQLSSSRNLTVYGDLVYLGNTFGLSLLDVSDPTLPVFLKNVVLEGGDEESTQVIPHGDYAFVGGDQLDFLILRLRNSFQPEVTATSYAGGSLNHVTAMQFAGDHLYLSGVGDDFQAIDVSDPSAPVLLDGLTVGQSQDFELSGNYAYEVTYNDFRVIDISDPSNLTFAGSAVFGTGMVEVEVEGNRVYVGSWTYGLYVVDVSDPSNPVMTNSVATSGARGVDVDGDLAFLAEGPDGLLILDVSDPDNALPNIGDLWPGGHAVDVVADGNHVYLACDGYGLSVIDVTDPNNPVELGVCSTFTDPTNMVVDGDYILVSDEVLGLQVVDVSDPTNPVVTYADSDIDAYAVARSGDMFCWAKSEFRLAKHPLQYASTLNTIQSLPVTTDESSSILHVRLNTTQIETVNWDVSPDSGNVWFPIANNGSWLSFPEPNNNLVWRSTHFPIGGDNPSCTALQIEMSFPEPVIFDCPDVPGDQGGQVNLAWYASGFDFYDQRTITHYSVWRAMQEIPGERGGEGSKPRVGLETICEEFQGEAFRFETVGGRDYFWEWVENVDAFYFEGYSSTVQTVNDSTAHDPGMHYFQVVAHTDDQWVFYTSAPDSGYSVDNLAPAMPLNLAGHAGSDPIHLELSWAPNHEADLGDYTVYRGESAEFVPDAANLVGATTDTLIIDYDWTAGSGYHYKVAARDIHGNESIFADLSPELVTSIDPMELPTPFTLAQNHPNPFNPHTDFEFSLASSGHVRLAIFDLKGRLIVTLEEGFRSAGKHTSSWSGHNVRGEEVSAGIYFLCLETDEAVLNRKLVLAK